MTCLEKRDRTLTNKEEVRRFLRNRDGAQCVNCGSYENLHIDHCVPWVVGGSNNYNNLQLLCQDCNYAKRTKIFNHRFNRLCLIETELYRLERECESFIPTKKITYDMFFYNRIKPQLIHLVGWARDPEWKGNAYCHDDIFTEGSKANKNSLIALTWEEISKYNVSLPEEWITTSEAWDICYDHLQEILGGAA